MHAIGNWDCPNPLDCLLRDHCWLKDRFGSEACAPYYGPPNYPLPAVQYTVDWFDTWYMYRILIYHDIGNLCLMIDYYYRRLK